VSPPPPGVPHNENFQEVHEWCEQRFLRIGVVVESLRPLLEVALKRSANRASKPEGLVDVVLEARLPRITESRYHGPPSVRMGESSTEASLSEFQ
jgi:hypothetical protein